MLMFDFFIDLMGLRFDIDFSMSSMGASHGKIIRRLIERHFHPDRFMHGTIDYIGEYAFPF